MALIDTIILVLVIISLAIGIMVALIATKIIELSSQANNKMIYSILVISLFILVICLFTKVLLHSTDQSADECQKKDPPFWCHLDAG